MAEYRSARPEERNEYIDLANYAFGADFETLLPKVYGKGIDSSSLQMVAVDEQGRMRALVAVLPERLNVCDHKLQTGYLGTVSVHPRARGEGHMKVLMNSWLERLSEEAYDMIVLAGQRQRYEYFGFTLGGARVKHTVTQDNIRHALKDTNAEGISFCPLFEAEGAVALAQRLNTSRLAHVERAAQILPQIMKTFNLNPLGVLEAGRLIGYLLVNKEGNEISELALEHPDQIVRTIKAYMANQEVWRVTVNSPDYDKALNAQLGELAEECVIETSDMYNILDFANVVEAYLTLKHRSTGLVAGEFSAVMDGQPVTARVDEHGVTVERTAKPDAVTLSKQQAQKLLLTQHSRYMEVGAPAGWFPLPLFWYKTDKF
ncbi:acetyltransferase (GNAT) family protein [Paenibacillus cellulosilyticus]|uniref:Acetyltransferase (GNAT) family protein n=1 Tax=Paenibacillus cellulosilyticus TaxID=375489 RepID=A0A2V2YX13_9BACL|nr:GNAT family N-acetyltransferase [Paenibacillus cellulosilyticus]PWV95900.1 acetyltransferase (GNAT) family protein [Paenibacillus cellulosilyticus]QKS47768.1 GNAT family N-acetyltransferase [Paenibacillus cellulosilyticus]